MAKKRQVHQIAVGTIGAVIEEDQSDRGTTRFIATISREYSEEGRVKRTTSFRHQDLPVLSKLADMAFLWMSRNTNRRPGATQSANHG